MAFRLFRSHVLEAMPAIPARHSLAADHQLSRAGKAEPFRTGGRQSRLGEIEQTFQPRF